MEASKKKKFEESSWGNPCLEGQDIEEAAIRRSCCAPYSLKEGMLT